MGESVSKLTIQAGVEGGAAAAGELQKVASSIDATAAASQAAQKAVDEQAAASARLARELAVAREASEAASKAASESELADQLKREAEAAELARPAIEALAEAQQRLAQLQALQAEGPAGRTVGEMLAINDAIGKQEGLIRTLGGEQQKYNTKVQDLVGIANRLNPRLGEMVLGLTRLLRISGDVATANIQLKDVFTSVTKAVADNIATVALVGAGGAVLFGINQIVSALDREKKMREEVAAATRKQGDALNDLRHKEQSEQVDIEKLADRRKEGGFDAAAAATARKVAAMVREQFKDLDPEAVNQAVVGTAGSDISSEELIRVAFGIQGVGGRKLEFGEKQGLESRTARARAFINRPDVRNATNIALERELQQAAPAEQARPAVEEAKTSDGTSVGIEDFIRSLPGKAFEGVDVEKVAEIVKTLRAAESKKSDIFDFAALIGGGVGDVVRGQGPGFTNLETTSRLLEGEGVKDATPQLIRLAEIVLQRLEKIESNTSKGGGDNYFTGPVSVQGSGPVSNGQTHAGSIGE